jgi:uncharacterized YccA/Bax inhibitor family protein
VLSRLADRSAQHATFRSAPAPAGYATGYEATTVADRMTVDDVVMRAVGMLAVVGLTGSLSWLLLGGKNIAPMVLFGAAGVGLILGLVISFARITNPALILTYAAVEGVFVGLISGLFESRYPGVVVQALVGTFGVFFGMAALYKFRVIRATPRFAKWVIGALIGVFSLMIVNFLASLFGVNGGAGLGLRDGGPLAIIFSIVCIGVAAMTFILDFAAIEDGVRYGADRRFAWYAAFGIVVGLIWLYLEILRLLTYMRR